MPTPEPPTLSIQPGPLRPVAAADRAAVLAVVGAVGLFTTEDLVEVEQTLDAFLTGTAGPGDQWVTAELGSGSAGVAYYAPERMAAGTWNLYLLAVAPAAQGTGRGAALVGHVEGDLRRRSESPAHRDLRGRRLPQPAPVLPQPRVHRRGADSRLLRSRRRQGDLLEVAGNLTAPHRQGTTLTRQP